MTAAPSRSYSGNNRRGQLRVPAHAHPLVRRLFLAMNAKRVTIREVAGLSNVGVDTIRFWGPRHVPRLDLFDAALNAIGLELNIQRRRHAAVRHLMSGFTLTHRQQEVLTFVEGYISRERQAPTYREIAAALNIGLSLVGKLLRQLKDRGAVDFLPNRSRSVVVLATAIKVPEFPADVAARLARYCLEHGESSDAVVVDALVLHLDAMAGEHAAEGERVAAGATRQ